jgi:hypothetical protein
LHTCCGAGQTQQGGCGQVRRWFQAWCCARCWLPML